MIQFTPLEALTVNDLEVQPWHALCILFIELTTWEATMFGKQSQFNGWDLASAERAPGFFDDLDAMLQEPVGLSSFNSGRASTATTPTLNPLPILEQPLFKSTFELLPEGALFVGTDGRISRVNNQVLGSLNEVEDNLLGIQFTQLISTRNFSFPPIWMNFPPDLTANVLMTLRTGRGEEIFVSVNARRLFVRKACDSLATHYNARVRVTYTAYH